MTALDSLLADNYPPSEECVEGRLVYVTAHGVTRLLMPTLRRKAKLEFYKAKFSTGYRNWRMIDSVVGYDNNSNQAFLLTNPIFSSRFSNLLPQLEQRIGKSVDEATVNEIVNLFRETGTQITSINKSLFQIWFGNKEWRIIKIESKNSLIIKLDSENILDAITTAWIRLFKRSESKTSS